MLGEGAEAHTGGTCVQDLWLQWQDTLSCAPVQHPRPQLPCRSPAWWVIISTAISSPLEAMRLGSTASLQRGQVGWQRVGGGCSGRQVKTAAQVAGAVQAAGSRRGSAKQAGRASKASAHLK